MGETIRQVVAVSKENVSRFDIGVKLVTDQTFNRIGTQNDARHRPSPGRTAKSSAVGLAINLERTNLVKDVTEAASTGIGSAKFSFQ